MKKSTAHISTSPAETSYFQPGPRLGNLFEDDTFFQSVLARLVSKPDVLQRATAELNKLGHRATYDLLPRARELDQSENHPRLVSHEAWGRRTDEIITHANWKYMHRVAAEEGVISDGYDYARWGRENARLVQYAKLYIYAPVSGLYSCPLAMTDGAVNYLKQLLAQDLLVGDEQKRDVEHLLQRLLSNHPDEFITSGQWMTERAGGSDVGQGTETIARKQADGTYALYGYKWFTSATDAHMALALARIEDQDGRVDLGSNGLSCFLVKLRKDGGGELNGIKVHRMKQKFGTKQLPTAELELVGTRAMLVSAPGRGIPAITTGMVNITRIHNAVSACAAIHLITALGRDYAHRRMVFGTLLAENELHLKTLAGMELAYRACLVLTFDAVFLLGRVEEQGGEACPPENQLLGGSSVAGATLTLGEARVLVRLLTPLCKVYTAKQAVQNVSEGLELFGGQGYMENTGLPQIYRDAQVLPIWEGTSNVLSHDVLRVLTKSKFEAFQVFNKIVLARCQAAMASGGAGGALQQAAAGIKSAMTELRTFLQENTKSKALESNAREFTLSLARVAAASCLLEHAIWTGDNTVDALAAARFTGASGAQTSALVSLPSFVNARAETELDRALALNLDSQGKPRGMGDFAGNGMERARF